MARHLPLHHPGWLFALGAALVLTGCDPSPPQANDSFPAPPPEAVARVGETVRGKNVSLCFYVVLPSQLVRHTSGISAKQPSQSTKNWPIAGTLDPCYSLFPFQS